MAAKRGADSQLTKDAGSDDDGVSVGSRLGGGQKATAAQMAARRLAKPRGGRRPGVARPPALPAPGMQQQQPFPSPFGQNNTFNTNGTQQQESTFGFGQQTQQPNGAQNNQISASFPPFEGSSNSNPGSNSSFPPPTSGFNFQNEHAKYINNPFSPNAEPPPAPKHFQGEIFRIFPPKLSKEASKKRLIEGEEAPQFAAHSPFHNNQQGASDPAQSQPASNMFGTASNSSEQNQVSPNSPFGQNTSMLQQSQSAQSTSSVFGNVGTPQQFPSNFFEQVAASTPQPQQTEVSTSQAQNQTLINSYGQSNFLSEQPQSTQSSSNLFGNPTSQPSSNFFGQGTSTSQPLHDGAFTSQAQYQAPPSTPFGQNTSVFQQPQPSQPQQTESFTPQAQNQAPSNSFGQINSVFQQPQFNQPTSNLFAHLGTPQPSSIIFGQGAAFTPQAQQPETITSPQDQTMMSASPDPSPQSRPFGSLNQSNTQQSNASGGSLFERISKPEPEAPSSTQSDTSKETIAPGQGGSLFSRITKPDANITAPPSSEVDTQASGSTIATKPANHVFGGFKKPQAPQGSSPAFESANGQGVSQKSTTPSVAQETSNTTQTSLGSQRAYGMCPLAPAEFTENEKRELTTGWRLKSLEVGLQGCLRKKPGDVEKARIRKFYEYSRQAILAAKGGPLTTPSPSGKRKVPDAEDKTCDKRARVDTPRKPLEGPDPGAKRKVTDGGDDAETPQGKKTRVESPHHGQNGRLQSPEKASSSSQTSAMFKGIITTNESEVGGIQVPKFGPPTNFMAQFGQAAEKSAEAAKKKRKAVDYDSDEDEAEWERKDEEEQRVKKQKIEEAARSKFAKFVNGKMVWAETNIFGQLPSEESRSDDEGNEDDGHDDDGPPSGGLFDRITRDESGNVVRDEPPPRQMPPPKARDETIDPNRDLPPVEPSEPFISSSSITPSNFRPPPPFIPPTTPKTNDGNTGDHTWKPESPITFGATSSAPAFNVTSPSPSKPALGGLFGAPKTNATAETSTKPTSGLFTTTPAESPSASLGFGFTPANAASKPQAPSFSSEFVATTGKSANESKTTAETSIKPASNLFSATPAKSPGISSGVGFTPANAASKSLVPPPSTGFTNTAGKSADTIAETPTKPASSLFSMTPARPSSVNVGFTPANVVSKSLPRPSNTESSEASRTTSSNATPGDSTTTTAETPIKPASNLFSTTRAKSSSINLGFTPANAASKSLAPPSNTESATTSRATSPSATTGESANEFNADDEDHMPKDNQIDLASGGPGEENEDTVFQVKAKAMLYDTEKKTWPIKGFGSFRVLKDRESGKTRMLMRQDPSGKILLNSALGKQLKYESSAKRMVMVPVVNAEGRLETWVIRTGLDDAAKKLASLLQEHKSA